MLKLARVALGFAALAGLASVVVTPARAQAPQPTLTINQADGSKFPNVTAIVTVLDANGVPVPDLAASDFRAFEGTTPLTLAGVQSAQNQGLSLATVIAIDVSGSMQGAPFDGARLAALQFIDSMGSNDQAAVIAFNDTVNFAVGLTSDKGQLRAGINGLVPSGGTALYEAVQTSAFIAASSSAARRAVIFLTDGENDTRASTATNDGSMSAANGAHVPMFTIGFGQTPAAAYLQILAASTQGAYRAADAGTISTVYSDIASLLRSQYVVNMRGAGNADGKDVALQIVAQVANQPVVGESSYRRGIALAVPAAPAEQPATALVPQAAKKKSNLPALIFAAIIIIIGAGAIAWLLLKWNGRRRQRLAQLKVVEPNIRQAAAQPFDVHFRPLAPPATNGSSNHQVLGTGVLREKNGTGVTYPLGAGPTIIGTSPRASIVLPPSDQVAPEHLRIWLRGQNYVLHHVGGVTRKTYVGSQEADWVTLESGDELTVGPHKLIFENPGSPNGA